ELHGFMQTFVVQFRDLVENLERFLGLVFDLFFGQLFVVELDDFLDRACTLTKIVPDRQKFLQNDRGSRNGFQDQQLSALDALGDGHFAFARQERDGSHFAQVHANRVVRLFDHPRRESEIARVFRDWEFVLGFHFGRVGYRGIGGGAGGFGRGLIFINVNPVFLKGGKKVVDFFRGVDFRWQNVIYFVIEQIPALLAHGNELPYLIVFLFDSQRQGVLQKIMPEAALTPTQNCKTGLESSIGKISNKRNSSFATRAQIDSACDS